MAEFNTYYAQTMPGCEEIAWLEIRDRMPHAKFLEYHYVKDQNGIVLWSDSARTADVLTLRTTEDVFRLAIPMQKLTRDWGDLRLISDQFRQDPMLIEAMRSKFGDRNRLTYRVISRKSGDHQYRRKDFEEACIKGIEQRRGHQWRLVDDNADVEIWVNILGSVLLCGVRLSDRSMRHRAYQVANRPAALRPSVAAAMVWLTDPQPDDSFLDPMCGSGTILAERLLAGPAAQVRGGDISRDSVQAAKKILSTLGKPFRVQTWDARDLPLETGSIDKLSINLPFGKQIGTAAEVRALYPRVFGEINRVLHAGAVGTVLSSEYELVKQTLRAYPDLQIMTGYSIAVLGQWGRFYIIKKT